LCFCQEDYQRYIEQTDRTCPICKTQVMTHAYIKR
jgi:C4-type Zn-finger protein